MSCSVSYFVAIITLFLFSNAFERSFLFIWILQVCPFFKNCCCNRKDDLVLIILLLNCLSDCFVSSLIFISYLAAWLETQCSCYYCLAEKLP